MEFSIYNFKVDMFGQQIVHLLVQVDDINPGITPFPFTEREFHVHQFGISQCRMIEIIEVLFRRHIDRFLRPASIYAISGSERLNLSGQKTITLPARGNLLFLLRFIPRLMSVDSVSLIIKRASA